MDAFWIVFSRMADVLSVVGLVITIVVARQVVEIKREMRRRGRIGPLSEKLKEHASALSELLRDFSHNRNHVSRRLATIESTLNSLVDVLGTEQGREFRQTHDEIKIARQNQQISETKAEEFLAELYKLIENLEQIQEDFKWKL